MKRQFAHWRVVYEVQAGAEIGKGYSASQIATADSRLDWVTDLLEKAEELVDMLEEPPVPGD